MQEVSERERFRYQGQVEMAEIGAFGERGETVDAFALRPVSYSNSSQYQRGRHSLTRDT